MTAQPAAPLEIEAVSYDDPEVAALVVGLQQEYVRRYGGPDETPMDSAQFAPPCGIFLVGRWDGATVACGGWRLVGPGDAEIKRMYVAEGHRGRGHARRLLAALEHTARDAGVTFLRLETGAAQPEAVALYESSGYRRIEPFGHYRCMPDSISFGKDL